MARMTPIQSSFSAGELSPLMRMRVETEGYRQGASQMTNLLPDSRGPAMSRSGTNYVTEFLGNDARILPVPVNDNFFYSALFLDKRVIIGSGSGHNPLLSYNQNANFNLSGQGWVSGTDGNPQSQVNFYPSHCELIVSAKNNRYAYVSQQFTVPATGTYRLQWTFDGNYPVDFKIGTTEDSSDILLINTALFTGEQTFTTASTTMWVTARIDSDNITPWLTNIQFLGVTDETPDVVDFITPYEEADLSTLQGIASPSGHAIYIVHESYPPYKLTYDRATDIFSWSIVTFTAPPAEWIAGSYPSAGDFFEGRLWLGGTVNEPQTFWASKSGLPEDFTSGVLADDSLIFTLAKYGRIEWMVGFKNLVIGTQNGEHIVTSDSGVITPTDIHVNQQSSYGSANIQPVQVGDQIFYVSADRRKLRAIQYEWQADNWLSKDLTFNSEHITKAGIKHISWQQNPNNLFHCILEDGTAATLVYERGHNIYGWSKLEGQEKFIDVATGPVRGADLANLVTILNAGKINFEAQLQSGHRHWMDSWVDREPDVPGGLVVSGLEHLEGYDCQVLVDDATHPNRVVVGGQITLQTTGNLITVGLQFIPKLATLPFDQGSPTGSGSAWTKRYNKVYVRVLDSARPLINGKRAPDRSPSTPMNTPEPAMTEEILAIGSGWNKSAIVTIEQDLPRNLIILGLFGELGQEKL